MRIHCCTHEPDATVCTGSACALPSQHSSTKLAAKAAADEAIKPNTNLCCAQKSLSLEFVFGATNETMIDNKTKIAPLSPGVRVVNREIFQKHCSNFKNYYSVFCLTHLNLFLQKKNSGAGP